MKAIAQCLFFLKIDKLFLMRFLLNLRGCARPNTRPSARPSIANELVLIPNQKSIKNA